MSNPIFRMLHTVIRVRDLEKSLDFYTRLLGMTLLRRSEFPEGKFTFTFVGYGDEVDHTGGRVDLQLGPARTL